MKSLKRLSVITGLCAALLLPVCCTGGADPYAEQRTRLWESYEFKPWTQQEKLYALSKFWMEVKRNFVYLDKVGEARWDSLYRSLIIPASETKNDWEFRLLMDEFCAFLNDGHTDIQSRPCRTSVNGFDSLYLACSYVDDRVIVSSISKSYAEEIPLGSEVIEINDLPTRVYYDSIQLRRTSASTRHVRYDMATRSLMNDLWYSKYKVKFRRPNGGERSISMHHLGRDRGRTVNVVNPTHRRPGVAGLHWYPGDIAYVYIHSFGVDSVPALFEKMLPEMQKRARGLILDLRNNGGGSTEIGGAILKHLSPPGVLNGSIWSTRTYNAAYAAWGAGISPDDTTGNAEAKRLFLNYHNQAFYYAERPMRCFSPASCERLIVPTAVLTSKYTASAAEDFLIFAEPLDHFVRIGETTYGSTGQPIVIELIPGMSCRICTKKDTYPDGREFVGVGIRPDIPVRITVADFLEGNDVVLKKALEVIGDKTTKAER